MNTLLVTLGYKPTVGRKIWLVSLFATTTLFILVLGYVAYRFLGWDPFVIHLMGWAGWFVWQGALFPANRITYLRHFCQGAYKRAFFQDILVGASFGVAQMIRPIFHALVSASFVTSIPVVLVSAATITLVGAFLLYSGFKAIGFDGAGFMYEFPGNSRPMVNASIYSHLRHPLFLGGVIMSIGVSMSFLSTPVWWLALLNVAILPLYRRLEDWRDFVVNGDKNQAYTETVNAFMPKLERLKEDLYQRILARRSSNLDHFLSSAAKFDPKYGKKS